MVNDWLRIVGVKVDLSIVKCQNFDDVYIQHYSGEEELCCVYVPTNHLYIGDIFLINSKDVIRPNLSVREGIGKYHMFSCLFQCTCIRTGGCEEVPNLSLSFTWFTWETVEPSIL
uniref:Uncharacterized protein n=1 Tax=Nelumbo nucifera TaxID=4432 RepID=A0A822ZHN1_NELNU|nr:TPA_asm: hypothetical protein HUJ06_002882 [Nelumbo nucifera]